MLEDGGQCREAGQGEAARLVNSRLYGNAGKFMMERRLVWELDMRPALSHSDKQTDCILSMPETLWRLR